MSYNIFLKMVERQFDVKVKVIRSDNAMELGKDYVHSEYLTSQGILHQISCVATLQQNGVVERKHRHILEVARAIRLQGHLLLKFWRKCVHVVVYVINRLPLSVLRGKSSFEILYGRPPSLQHMRIIGCLCFASNVGGGDNTARSTATVLMGYSSTQKGYRLYNILTNQFFVSKDVKFMEHIFPF